MAAKKKSAPVRAIDKILSDKELVTSAYQEGIAAISSDHPQFRGNESYLTKHIDQRKMRAKIAGLSKDPFMYSARSLDEKKEYFRKNLANYVATGGIFDDKAKEVVLKKGLEAQARKGFFKGLFSRRVLKGEKYLDNTIEAFQDLYSMFKSGNYAERMPELEKSLQTVNDMGFLNPADCLFAFRS